MKEWNSEIEMLKIVVILKGSKKQLSQGERERLRNSNYQECWLLLTLRWRRAHSAVAATVANNKFINFFITSVSVFLLFLASILFHEYSCLLPFFKSSISLQNAENFNEVLKIQFLLRWRIYSGYDVHNELLSSLQ